jgi:hypothetical protein
MKVDAIDRIHIDVENMGRTIPLFEALTGSDYRVAAIALRVPDVEEGLTALETAGFELTWGIEYGRLRYDGNGRYLIYQISHRYTRRRLWNEVVKDALFDCPGGGAGGATFIDRLRRWR